MRPQRRTSAWSPHGDGLIPSSTTRGGSIRRRRSGAWLPISHQPVLLRKVTSRPSSRTSIKAQPSSGYLRQISACRTHPAKPRSSIARSRRMRKPARTSVSSIAIKSRLPQDRFRPGGGACWKSLPPRHRHAPAPPAAEMPGQLAGSFRGCARISGGEGRSVWHPLDTIGPHRCHHSDNVSKRRVCGGHGRLPWRCRLRRTDLIGFGDGLAAHAARGQHE